MINSNGISASFILETVCQSWRIFKSICRHPFLMRSDNIEVDDMLSTVVNFNEWAGTLILRSSLRHIAGTWLKHPSSTGHGQRGSVHLAKLSIFPLLPAWVVEVDHDIDEGVDEIDELQGQSNGRKYVKGCWFEEWVVAGWFYDWNLEWYWAVCWERKIVLEIVNYWMWGLLFSEIIAWSC